MKLLILLIVMVLCAFGGDDPTKGPPPAPVLTDAQKAAIGLALYDSEFLNPARAAIAKAEQALRVALQACGAGFVISRDPETRELKCVPQPAPPPSPAAVMPEPK